MCQMNINYGVKTWVFVFIKTIAVLVLIYLVFVAVIAYLFSPDHDIFKKVKFNRSMWEQDVSAGMLDNKLDCQRGKMTQDIIDNVLVKNLSKEDVVKLLGEPDSLVFTSFNYEIGWCGYIDSNSLRIDFDDNGLLKAYIVNH
jgi:cbb3-type cytochrome oxidase subunit 3